MKQLLFPIVVCISLIYIFLFTSILTVLSPTWTYFEYNKSSFPADSLGLNLDTRFSLALQGINYVSPWVNMTPTGQELIENNFNHKELSHLNDVHTLLTTLLNFGAVVTIFFISILGYQLMSKKKVQILYKSITLASEITLATVGILSLAIITSWEKLFVAFHRVFFPQGNWAFYQDDMLIRLFPPEYWFDTAIMIGVLLVIQSCLWFLLARIATKKRLFYS